MIMRSSARDYIPIVNVYKLSEFQKKHYAQETAELETAANNLSAPRLLSSSGVERLSTILAVVRAKIFNEITLRICGSAM